MQRKYLPSLSELIDRMVISQMKLWKLDNSLKKQFEQEILDIMHDIDLIIKEEKIQFTAEILRAIAILGTINSEIWNSEANARKSGTTDGTDLLKSHKMNSTRCAAKCMLQNAIGGRVDPKIDYLDPQWSIELGKD